MPTIAVIGEIIADAVLPADGISDGVARLTVHPGGGPANTATALSRLGTHARFGARISGGALGALCRAKLEESNVDLSAAETATEAASLAIARLDASGAATYEFYVEGTADWAWTPETLAPVTDGPFPAGTGAPVAVHTGSLALALQPAGQAIEALLGRVRDRMTTSVDPNLRPLLVPVDEYRRNIDRWVSLADIVRLSEDDLELLWPGWTPERCLAHLHAQGVVLAIVSLGADGAVASLRGEQVRVPIAPTDLVDTVGAGDSFQGGLLHHLAEHGHLGGRLDRLDIQSLTAAMVFGSRVSAINCSRAGANPPWAAELD